MSYSTDDIDNTVQLSHIVMVNNNIFSRRGLLGTPEQPLHRGANQWWCMTKLFSILNRS